VPKDAANTVLSFSLHRTTLREREVALRKGEFQVHSANTETQARFEIEMGRCGIFLICSRAAPLQAKELTSLFRRYCPDGRIIFVMNELEIEQPLARICLFRNPKARKPLFGSQGGFAIQGGVIWVAGWRKRLSLAIASREPAFTAGPHESITAVINFR
jgi:hypothetical protein